MTRLFACTCNQPEHLVRAIEPTRHVLVAQGPIARWGFGYVQSGEVLLSHNPRPLPSDESLDWFERLRDVRSDYLIALATADDGLHGPVNTQPFRYRRWLFAQESAGITESSDWEAQLTPLIPEFLRRRISGKSLSEYVFNILLSRLHANTLVDVYDLPPQQMRQAVTETITSVQRAGQGSIELGNLAVTNGRTLLSVCLDRPLYMRRLSLPDKDAKAHGFKGVLIVSDAGANEPGFERIPAASMIVCSRNLSTEVLPLGT